MTSGPLSPERGMPWVRWSIPAATSYLLVKPVAVGNALLRNFAPSNSH
jgi:hypothetical protein